jgi:hypothetical protein
MLIATISFAACAVVTLKLRRALDRWQRTTDSGKEKYRRWAALKRYSR